MPAPVRAGGRASRPGVPSRWTDWSPCGWCWMPLSVSSEQEMGLPQEHVFAGSGEPKGSDADQDGELFKRRGNPLNKVDQGGERAAFGPCLLEGGDGGVVEVLDKVEAEGEGLGCGSATAKAPTVLTHGASMRAPSIRASCT